MPEITRKDRERLLREEEILDAAEKVFDGKGFEGALMNDIAREAQFSRKTLYQYFGSKEELLSAVILREFHTLLSVISESVDERVCGFEKLRAMGQAFYRFYQEYSGFFGLIHYLGRMKSIDKDSRKEDFERIDKELFRIVMGAIDEGKADGSIRRDIDTAMAAYSLKFSLTGFFVEYLSTGRSYTEHLSLDEEKFVRYSLDLMMDALRAKA